jgi:sRNA-binding protein
LKIAIDSDLAALGYDARPALAAWTAHPLYLRRLIAGPGQPRIGLDGAAAGTVTADEADFAWTRLMFLRADITKRQSRLEFEKWLFPELAPLTADEAREVKLRLPKRAKQGSKS